MADYSSLRKSLLEKAALDLAGGATMLKTYRMGIVFVGNKLRMFSVQYAEEIPQGTVVATVSLKAFKAFEKHRENPEVRLTEREMNAAVYYATFLLSKSV